MPNCFSKIMHYYYANFFKLVMPKSTGRAVIVYNEQMGSLHNICISIIQNLTSAAFLNQSC